jgi:hypothetical protein
MSEKYTVQEIGEKAKSLAETLLLRKVDDIVSVAKEGEAWIVDVEVVERKSIPDTQDLIGKYEMKFDSDGELTGYRRIVERHRSDMEAVKEDV